MVVIPCAIKTLTAIAYSFNTNLLVRAADVVLKEKRRLVLVPREMPLHRGHLEAMLKVYDLGGIILPPMLTFYQTEAIQNVSRSGDGSDGGLER